MSTSGCFQNYEYDVGINDGNWFMPTGEQGEMFVEEGQGCIPYVRDVTHEVSGNHLQDITYIVTLVMFKMTRDSTGDSDVPRNIDYEGKAEEMTQNDGSLLDMNGQGPHGLPRDGDMPTLIYMNETEEGIGGGEMVMYHREPQAEPHLAHWGGQLDFALEITVHESGEISEDFPAHFQPFKFTGREPMATTKEVIQGM